LFIFDQMNLFEHAFRHIGHAQYRTSGGDDPVSTHAAIVMLALALVVVIASLIAAAAGYLAHRGGIGFPTAIACAATAFATTLTTTASLTVALTAVVGGR
jgi:hypothetical protein